MTWLLLMVLIYKISLKLFLTGNMAVTVETGLAVGTPVNMVQEPYGLRCMLRIGTRLGKRTVQAKTISTGKAIESKGVI